MTRKDTILVAVVINAGLLAILFATAVIYDEDTNDNSIKSDLVLNQNDVKSPSLPVAQTIKEEQNQAIALAEEISEPTKSIDTLPMVEAKLEPITESKESAEPPIVQNKKEITPPATKTQLTPKKEKKEEPVKIQKKDDTIYHVVKSGDNPWKIAKQYGVKYDDILRLNNLNEEKARNLKIGDKIRVK